MSESHVPEPSLLDKALDASVVLGYTNIGYNLRRRGWKDLEPGALAGKTVVITGATSGLGRAAAGDIAGLGARVVIVARDPEKAGRVKDEIAAATGNDDLASQIADLSLMAEVRDVAARLLETEPRIDVLVNNAGVLFTERGETSEGIEQTLATDLLGHFLLTNLLIPRLVASAPSRIINVSSGGMYTQGISLRNLQSTHGEYKGSVAYARAKRGQVILTEMWAEKLAGTGVAVHAMHPGWADTAGVQGSLPTFRRITGPFLRSAEEGADTMVWLAAADAPGESSGLFWHDRRPRPTHRIKSTRSTEAERSALWDRLAELSRWEGTIP
jgi:dehydrogenase/reductase SDR family member 12